MDYERKMDEKMKEIELKYSGKRVDSFTDIISAFGKSEFKSHTRSTVPFLQFWRCPGERIKELARHLKINLGESAVFDFEHKVPVVKGKGKASHTDLKIILENLSLTIEAKYLESRYPTCSKWLKNTKTPKNKKMVLEGWINLLNEAATSKISLNDVQELPYQVIHRAASACHSPKDKRVLIYQLFDADEKKRNMYLADLKKLSELVGKDSKLGIYYVDCHIGETTIWRDLTKNWKNGARDLSNETMAGLKNGSLIRTKLSEVMLVQ